MADISKLEQHADLLMQNVMGWENSTLQRIGKRIKKYGKLSLADVKSINNIAVVKQDMDAITKELAKVTGYNISQIEQMYGDLLTEQHLANQPLYDYSGKKFVPFAENKELQAIARAYAKTTGETMINLSKTKLLCIKNEKGVTVTLQKGYTDILDKAVMQVTSGGTDFHTAMRDAIVQLGGGNMRVNYEGITRRLDTVVRQNLLWGAKQASIEYNEMIGQELGCDGYEIDYHSNPRPSHAFMQGRQFCVGKSKKIMGKMFDGMEDTVSDISGKNVTQSLQDYGCLHYKTPILCGISEPRYSEEELSEMKKKDEREYTINGKTGNGYFWSQEMRKLETVMREQKGIKVVAQASGNITATKNANSIISACEKKYNEISEITGLMKETKRMTIPRNPKT